MSWTDSQVESLITFYSSVLVSGARNFATGVKNRRQKPTPVFWRMFLAPVSGPCVTGIRVDYTDFHSIEAELLSNVKRPVAHQQLIGQL